MLFKTRAEMLYWLQHARSSRAFCISDKARIASILNSFKNEDTFYPLLVSVFTKGFSIYKLYKSRKSWQKVFNLEIYVNLSSSKRLNETETETLTIIFACFSLRRQSREKRLNGANIFVL